MNVLFNFVHMPDHIRDMSFHLMNRYFYSKFTVYKEGGPYSPDPRNTDATWSIFYTKVHLCHRSRKKKFFWCHPKNPSKKLKK